MDLIFSGSELVPDLPELDAVGMGMAVFGALGAHRRLDGAVEVFDFVGGILGGAPVEADADQRLGARCLAELNELFDSGGGVLETAPGVEGAAAIGVADGR